MAAAEEQSGVTVHTSSMGPSLASRSTVGTGSTPSGSATAPSGPPSGGGFTRPHTSRTCGQTHCTLTRSTVRAKKNLFQTDFQKGTLLHGTPFPSSSRGGHTGLSPLSERDKEQKPWSLWRQRRFTFPLPSSRLLPPLRVWKIRGGAGPDIPPLHLPSNVVAGYWLVLLIQVLKETHVCNFWHTWASTFFQRGDCTV